MVDPACGHIVILSWFAETERCAECVGWRSAWKRRPQARHRVSSGWCRFAFNRTVGVARQDRCFSLWIIMGRVGEQMNDADKAQVVELAAFG